MNGLYEVSNFGKVKSLKYKKDKILKPSFDKNGYTSLNLCKNGKISHKTIHRLVAESFIPNPNNYPCVNHKDENPRNNTVENLEWCTYKYNMNYGTCAERRNKNNKIAVNQYDKTNKFIKKWESAIDIQNEIGINQGSIIACCKNKLKTAGGYIWQYAEFNIRQKTKKELIKEIENLQIQLNEEKEKNKELLKYEEYYKEMEEVNKKFISKDKIREKIKYLNEQERSWSDERELKVSDKEIIYAMNTLLELLDEYLEEVLEE